MSQHCKCCGAVNATISVTNMMGQEIVEEEAKQKTITLQFGNNGVYIVYVKQNKEQQHRN